MFVWPEGGSTKRNEDEEKVEEEDKNDMDKKWKCVDESEEDKGRDGVEKVDEDKDGFDREDKDWNSIDRKIKTRMR